MKNVYWVLGWVCMFGLVAQGASLHFATDDWFIDSWEVTGVSGVYTMTFENLIVDTSVPVGDAVVGDAVNLPSMALSGITMYPSMITAALTPASSELLSLVADTGQGTVMEAEVNPSGLLAVGTNWMAYSATADDLDLVSWLTPYSAVIDTFVAAEAAGYDVDLSFSGDGVPTLYNMLLNGSDGSVSGPLSGQISAVPEPVSLVLLSLGGVVLARRRTL